MSDKIDKEQADMLLSAAFNSDDGTVFGFQMPEPFLSFFTAFKQDINDFLTKTGAPTIKNAVTKMAIAAKVSPELAEKIGDYSGIGFAHGLPYLSNIFDFRKVAKDHKDNKKWLDDQLSTFINAHSPKNEGIIGNITGMFSGGYAGNKMLDTANGFIANNTKQKLSRESVKLLPNLINNRTTYIREKIESSGVVDESGEKSESNLDIGKHEKELKFLTGWGNKIAGVLGIGINKMMKSESPKNLINKSSLGMVLKIQEYMRQNEIGERGSPSNSEVSQITNMVANVFQQFQKEQGHPAIPSHRMNELAKQISEELVFGDMQPLSLIDLIGKETLLNEQKNGVVNSERAKDIISAEIAIFSKGSTVNVTEFMGEQNHELEDIKSHLASENKDMRAMVTILYPQSVLVAAGLKPQEISELRDHLSNEVIASMFSVVIDDLAQRPKLELQDMGFSTEAINSVRRYKDRPEEIAEVIANESSVRKGLENIVRAGAGGQDCTYWQDLVAQTHERAEILEKVMEEKTREQEPEEEHGYRRRLQPKEEKGAFTQSSRRNPIKRAEREQVANDRYNR